MNLEVLKGNVLEVFHYVFLIKRIIVCHSIPLLILTIVLADRISGTIIKRHLRLNRPPIHDSGHVKCAILLLPPPVLGRIAPFSIECNLLYAYLSPIANHFNHLSFGYQDAIWLLLKPTHVSCGLNLSSVLLWFDCHHGLIYLYVLPGDYSRLRCLNAFLLAYLIALSFYLNWSRGVEHLFPIDNLV